jgi:hypothetical protein
LYVLYGPLAAGGLEIMPDLRACRVMIITKLEVKVKKILPEAKVIYTCWYILYFNRGELARC